jgi:hypothetical protein
MINLKALNYAQLCILRSAVENELAIRDNPNPVCKLCHDTGNAGGNFGWIQCECIAGRLEDLRLRQACK